jgi:putative membrane protein
VDPATLFSDAERRAISEAAREAERRTSGEIVPYVVGVCDDYRETVWKAAVLGALVGGSSGVAAHFLGGVWGGSPWLWVVLPAVLLAVASAVVGRISESFRRLLIPDEVLDLRARQRAAEAFLEEEVFTTRDRTGILIFVGLFEHRVVVLGDAGINRAVPEGAWQGVVADLVAGIKAERTAETLVEAIRECGRLLEAHRVEIRSDDTDELANELRLRDR